MKNIICKICGGTVTLQENCYVCSFCRNKWVKDSADDQSLVELINAWQALRENDFEKAIELFQDVIFKDDKNHEAYWGRALAMNGIVYVTDYNENKKVPTCNNITENSFLTNKDVKKAISLAPIEIKESYQNQAEQIEKIRVEWLEKARKEPPYDIFICFKDGDREHGIDRTQDSIDVQDLYTALVQKGYNVFFSRVTLRGKVAEHYEPYIYNALKTAKVMIVFGEKVEYFNSVWVKNEWSRFRHRIEKGEKHKNSLITVYKNVNPYDLPIALVGGRQAIDYGVPSNYEILMNHIKRVIDQAKEVVHLDRIEIKGGQMSKRSSHIQTETLKTRELGSGAVAQTSISEKQTLKLVASYIKAKQLDGAKQIVDDVLFDNPSNVEALVCKLQIEMNAVTEKDAYLKCASSKGLPCMDIIDNILNNCDKSRATKLLNIFYEYGKQKSAKDYHKLLKKILPFNYEQRQENIDSAFEFCIKSLYYDTFKLLLSTLRSEDVDKYIQYNLAYAKEEKANFIIEECVTNVLYIEEGNVEALKIKLSIQLNEDNYKEAIDTIEKILKYTKNTKVIVKSIIKQIKSVLNSDEDCLVFREVLRYYPGEFIELKEIVLETAFIMIKQGCFEHAEYLLKLVSSVDQSTPEVYLGICLLKLGVKTEAEILKSNVSLNSLPEFRKYLTLLDDEDQIKYINLATQHDENINHNNYLNKYPILQREKEITKKYISLEKENLSKPTWESVMGGFSFGAMIVAILLCCLAVSCFVSCNVENFSFFIPIALGLFIFSAFIAICVGAIKLVDKRKPIEGKQQQYELAKKEYDELQAIPKYDKNTKYTSNK